MKADEGAVPVVARELGPCVESQTIGSPVRGEENLGLSLRGAIAELFAIATVLGRLHQLPLDVVVVAIRPSVIAALIDLQQLLGGEILPLLRRVEFGPVLEQLIAAVLCRVQLAPAVERDSDSIANSCGVPLARRESLIRLAGIV